MPEPIIHELKLDPRWFDAVSSGAKPFEVRKDDRPYAVGDVLVLREWEGPGVFYNGTPIAAVYTGRTIRRTVTFTLRHADFEGVAEGYAVLGIKEARTDD